MTTGIRNTPSAREARAVRNAIDRQFREAVNPPFGTTVRSRGIDDDGIRILDERYRFDRGRVRKTEKRDVARIERVASRIDILTDLFRKSNQLQVVSL